MNRRHNLKTTILMFGLIIIIALVAVIATLGVTPKSSSTLNKMAHAETVKYPNEKENRQNLLENGILISIYTTPRWKAIIQRPKKHLFKRKTLTAHI